MVVSCEAMHIYLFCQTPEHPGATISTADIEDGICSQTLLANKATKAAQGWGKIIA